LIGGIVASTGMTCAGGHDVSGFRAVAAGFSVTVAQPLFTRAADASQNR